MARAPLKHRALRRAAPWLLAAAVLAGCGSVQPPGTGAPGAAGGPSVEQQRDRLVRELSGTPVVVEASGDSGYRVQVPLKYAFDPKRSVVKPPLAAVLDRVALSLRGQSAVQVAVAAPSDGRGGDLLARDRAESARDYLVGRGVPRERFIPVGRTAAGSAVEILVSERGATAAR